MKHAMCGLAALLALAMAGQAQAKDEKDWSMATRLYGDTKARHVGDLLTVLILEASSASKEAQSKTDKQNSLGGSISIGHPSIDSQATPWTNAIVPTWSVKTDRSFEGGGEMENKDELKATITVRVTEVLPNKNLIIEGRRTVVVNGEQLGFILTGTVRPNDISRENTINSTLIADANIQYFGTGSLVRSQRKGILTSLWDWLNLF
ncbi:MAG: flagellar basal body L-ring protein FlgH [Kiritimatiellae bacterium]|nr:flagellar basal body L-ring protein FlgH [Kiritimatiellia bacterium]